MENLTHFINSDAGFAAAFSAVATVAAAVLGHFLRGRVRLIWFSPNSTNFQIKPADAPDQIIYVNSGQIIVQNLGRQSAKDVQITSVPGVAPAGYVLLPSLDHSIRHAPNGEWVVSIPFLAPKEVITLQILNGPMIATVRCADSMGKYVPVIHQRLYSKPILTLIAFLMLCGALSIFFVIGWLISEYVIAR